MYVLKSGFIIQFLIVCSVIRATMALGQEPPPPLVTDRPDQTESPVTVPLKSLQIEMGFVFADARGTETETETETRSFELGSTLFRYGLLDYLELRLSGGFVLQKTRNNSDESQAEGIGGINTGLKIHLITEDQFLPETGLIADIIFPIGHSALTSQKTHPGFIFAMGYSLSERFSLSFNLGGRSGDHNPFIFRYSAALGIGLSEKTSLFLETFGLKPSLSKNLLNLDTGFTYLLGPDFQLDSSAGLSVTEKPFEWFINVGFSWRLSGI